MNPSSLKRKLPGILCLAYIAAIQAERGLLLARGTGLPERTVLFDYVVFTCLIGYWFEIDNHKMRVFRVWDMGYFLSFGWPFIIPYYLVKTRGVKRAVFLLLGLAAFYFAVEIGAAILSMALR